MANAADDVSLHVIISNMHHCAFLPRCMECRRGLAMRVLSVHLSVRVSVCPSVRPSVRLSNACFVTKWKKDRSRFLYHTKDHLAWFSEKNGWSGRPLLPKIFGSACPRWSEIANFEPIFACSSSAKTPSEKILINTNRKSIMCFPMSLIYYHTLLLSLPKRKTADFRLKSHFA